jgi:hypothetical protein
MKLFWYICLLVIKLFTIIGTPKKRPRIRDKNEYASVLVARKCARLHLCLLCVRSVL